MLYQIVDKELLQIIKMKGILNEKLYVLVWDIQFNMSYHYICNKHYRDYKYIQDDCCKESINYFVFLVLLVF